MKISTLFFILLAVMVSSASAFAAETASAQSITKDATQATHITRLQPETGENSEGSYGAAPFIHARGVQGGKAFRSDMLVRFDLAALQGTVSGAVIRIHKTTAPYVEPLNSGPNPIAAYPLLVDWDESKVSWDTFYKQNVPFVRPAGKRYIRWRKE